MPTPPPGPEASPTPPESLTVHAPESTVDPFTPTELRGMLGRPGEALDLVLAKRERLAATIAAGRAPWPLVAVLVLCTAVASLPYGLVRGGGDWWKIGALFGGSALLCFPSLQVFGAYLGGQLRPLQNLALAFVVSSVGALFTLGFAPIVWFLRATMQSGDLVDADGVSVAMLAAALLAGLAQLSRCAMHTQALRASRSMLLLVGWQVLVAFVAFRMGRALGLLA